jgi:hypothetical protein
VNSVATIAAPPLWREMDKFHHKDAGNDCRKEMLPNRHIYSAKFRFFVTICTRTKGPVGNRTFSAFQVYRVET